jgi:hypothetical protein
VPNTKDLRPNMKTLSECDLHFKEKDATHYHDSYYPSTRVYTISEGYVDKRGGLFARHYFNADGVEIGYVLPEFLEFGSGIHYFMEPRVWGIEKNLIAL